jgi:cobalt-zinc-cadmium efflux system outer membrane protein
MNRNILLFVLVFSASSFCIEAREPVLTIQAAIDSAYNNNSSLQQMRAQLKQKENLWRTETGISAPEILYFKEGISTGEDIPFAEQRIAISQEVDFPLTTIYRQKAIKEEVKSLVYQIQAYERKLKAEVKSQYVEVLYALYLQNLRENQVTLARDLYNAVYTKFETGMATGVDIANAELRLNQAKNDLDESEWILHKARYGLFNAMGLAVDQQKYSIEFADTLVAEDIEISQIESLSVRDEQPEYQASEHELMATELYLKEVKSNILPDIRFSLYKQDYGSGYNFNGFEVGLSIPLWYPLEQKGNINMTNYKREEILWKQNEIRLDIKKQIEYAWHNYFVSRKILKRYNESMKDQARNLQSMALKSYQLGKIGLLELLNAQQTYLDSEQRYLAALRDYYLQLVALEKYMNKDLVY